MTHVIELHHTTSEATATHAIRTLQTSVEALQNTPLQTLLMLPVEDQMLAMLLYQSVLSLHQLSSAVEDYGRMRIYGERRFEG